MATIFETIADGLSDFAGDIKNAFNSKTTPSGPGKFLSYPNTLGNDSGAIVYNSDHMDGAQQVKSFEVLDLDQRISERNNAQSFGIPSSISKDTSSEPFIMMEFYRIVEPENLIAAGKKAKGLRTQAQNVPTNSIIERRKGGGRPAAVNTKLNKTRDVVQDNLTAEAEAIEKQITAIRGTRVLNKTIAMYMTSAITLNDTMNYDQESRRTAANTPDSLKDFIGLDAHGDKNEFSINPFNIDEDKKVVAASFAAQLGGLIGYNLPGKAGQLLGGVLGGAGADVFGDEALRQMGKALNPNEYMQYKNTALRSFSFQWKMLPDSAKESNDCVEIIKIFRGAAHANRKSSMTLTVPDYIHMSFHGVGGMIDLPAMVISNVSVTYNPNAASFFKQNNHPVEIDLSITLSEIVPIYRDDVELGGF